MKRILILLLLSISTSISAETINKKNSIYIGYGGPFFYSYYSSLIITYGYMYDINKTYSASINLSAFPGRALLTNYSFYYNYQRIPVGRAGENINYFIFSVGDIGYDVLDNGVFGYAIGAGTKNSHDNHEFYLEAYYLVGIDPAYVLTGPRGTFSSGIRYRF